HPTVDASTHRDGGAGAADEIEGILILVRVVSNDRLTLDRRACATDRFRAADQVKSAGEPFAVLGPREFLAASFTFDRPLPGEPNQPRVLRARTRRRRRLRKDAAQKRDCEHPPHRFSILLMAPLIG